MENKSFSAANVASFAINHDFLDRGLYVSRKDSVGGVTVTTFDIRMKKPNAEPVLDNPAIHTLEHLMAVYLRGGDNPLADKILYVGPMGCRTGMYLIMTGDFEPLDIKDMLVKTFAFIIGYSGKIPATTSAECGNYLDHNLTTAKWESVRFFEDVLLKLNKNNTTYPTTSVVVS